MKRLAVFDLDGTLVDTAPDLHDTTNLVLARHGIPPVSAEILRPHIGLGGKAMIRRSLREAGREMTDDEVAAIHVDFLDHYATRIARFSRPFPEMLAALDALHVEGVAVAVCTNKRELLARQLLDTLSLSDRFVFVAGADTFGVAKPDPEHLWRTIAAAGCSNERAVFVGDSKVDFDTARAAAIPFVGTTYGYSEVAMEVLGPDRLLREGENVAAAVMALLVAPRQAGASV